MELKINLPRDVKEIIKKLYSNGFEAFVVGGCVRDSILGREPNDWDITTDALPQDTMRIFNKTFATGIKHGTVTVVLNGLNYEITTYRLDHSYENYRRPKSITFTKSIYEDLGRRDFTFNAMAYNEKVGFLDPYKGLSDLKRKLVRTVGNPVKRFNEDALRMLRAIRFAAQLNFKIENETYKAIKRNNYLLKNISNDRIRDEVNKILLYDTLFLFKINDIKIMEIILPEIHTAFYGNGRVSAENNELAMHSILSANLIEKDIVLKWVMLLHDIGKAVNIVEPYKNSTYLISHQEKSSKAASKILNRLHFDKKTINQICDLIKYHHLIIDATPVCIRKTINLIGYELFEKLIKVKEANLKAHNIPFNDERILELSQILKIYDEVIRKKECCFLSDLDINGKDIIDLGIKDGKTIGVILKDLLDLVIMEPKLNNKEKLINIVKDRYL